MSLKVHTNRQNYAATLASLIPKATMLQ